MVEVINKATRCNRKLVQALDAGTFAEFRSRYSERLAQRAED